MREEVEHLFSQANQVNIKDVKKNSDMKLGIRTNLLSKIFKSLF